MMKFKNIKENFKDIGTIKAVITRTRNDLGYGTFLMMFYLCLERGMAWYWFLIIPAYMIFKLKDMDKYHGQEAEYNFQKSPPQVRMYRMIEDIHKKIIIKQ